MHRTVTLILGNASPPPPTPPRAMVMGLWRRMTCVPRLSPVRYFSRAFQLTLLAHS